LTKEAKRSIICLDIDSKVDRGDIKMAKPINVTTKTFQNEVLDSDVPVLVDFWAPWCGPCRMIAPILEQIANEQEGKLKVTKLNVDEEPDMGAKYGVRGIPAMLLFKGGKKVETAVGYMPKGRLMSKLQPHLN
jgi:thioredoxin 1